MQHIVVLSIDSGDPSLTDFHHGLLTGLLEAAYRYSELKISNAFYKFGYLHIDELGVDRKRLTRWRTTGKQIAEGDARRFCPG
jgi:hypothetical protein